MIIDHISFSVLDYQASKLFFTKALQPLGISLLQEVQGYAGFGKDGKAELWFGEAEQAHPQMHLAFVAETRQQVRDFYQAALQAGGLENGAPGIREIYHPDYYGAFVIGPDGHNIEAVCHKPQQQRPAGD